MPPTSPSTEPGNSVVPGPDPVVCGKGNECSTPCGSCENLGDARTVVNVGAGTGSYEPKDRHVVAIEPSDVMAAQRSGALAPAIRTAAGNLPLRDGSVDAAMSALSLHHWDEQRERGVRGLRRVTRGPVVILTFDAGFRLVVARP